MARMTILADDLTGAADCALPAVRVGARVTVSLTTPDPGALDGSDVVAWDLDMRRLARAGATVRVGRAARATRDADAVYIRTESVPRRDVGGVVDAALAASGRRVAVVATALPALERVTVDGRQHAPAWPAAGIDLVSRLRATARALVVPVGIATVRNGGFAQACGSQPSVILACDAVTDEDLERIVVAGSSLGEPPVWVGSTGLAAPLTTSILGSAQGLTSTRARRTGPVLVVVGSVARPMEAQPSQLRSVLRVAPVEVDALALAHGGARADHMIDDAALALARALGVGADAALYARGLEPKFAGLSARVAAGLAEAARRALRRVRAGGLVLTGDQTARAVCDALGITAIELVGEIEPGVPLGRAVGMPLDIVAKAGTFGDRLSLVRALAAFERGAA
jgi:uncharacterized protein YgbK (DUF1537 family)